MAFFMGMYVAGTVIHESPFEPLTSPASLSSGMLTNLCSTTPPDFPTRFAAASSAFAVPCICIVRALNECLSLFARKRQVAESMPPESRTIASVSPLRLFLGA